ncbi:MAG: hypothetical protein JRH16_13230 [Deltaproteobacteria bacterium]|nr:hypothetical protein [Deltaproteobacteria bacterium]MBW2361281.1 hypothetical protein [Deltaproteobacteria bacterium]
MLRRALPVGLLLVTLAGFVPLKLNLDYGLGEWANDADYYFTIARSVSEGEGFKSNLSLYYQGFKTLPHHVTSSPVWPAMLGAIGAVFGIDAVATPVPVALYFIDLVLLYFLAQRLRRGIAPGAGWLFRGRSVVNLGHVAVLVFAGNVVFFQFSSVPNNEPLAFCLIFGGLIAVDRAARGLQPGWAFVAGLLAGLACLTRVQALALAVAVPLAFAAVALGDPRARRLGPISIVGVLLPFVPWVLYLASWNDSLTFGTALGLDTQRETPELKAFSHAFFPESWLLFLRDRLSGVGVAFDWRSPESYVSHFGALAYVAPAALAHCGWLLARRWRPRRVEIALEHALPLATVMTGIGMLLPVHAAHMTFGYEWLFGFRHGLPLILLIVPALAYLDAHSGRVGRLVAAGLVGLTLLSNAQGMRALFDRELKHGLTEGEQHLIAWLDRQRPLRAVVTTEPWKYGAFSRSGYHWTLCRHPPEQTLRLLRNAGADYVVIRHKERNCNFIRDLQPDTLRRVAAFRNGVYVLGLSERFPRRSESLAKPGRALDR